MSEQEENYKNLITEEECKVLLENMLSSQNETGTLVSYEIARNVNAVGNLGEYFNLYIKYYKDNGDETKKNLVEKTLFIKTMPYQRPEMCDYINKSRIFWKESRLYTQFLNALSNYSPTVWCTQCYFNKSDLFVIQNAVDLGYEPIDDVTRYFSRQEIEAVLKGLAAMHASSYAFERNKYAELSEHVQNSLFEVSYSDKVVWFSGNVKSILMLLEDHPIYQADPLHTYIRKELPTVLNSTLAMAGPSSKYRNVLSHRDIWRGNVFFSKTDLSKSALFVDFQFSCFSPPAIDVLMTLFLNLKPSKRKPLEVEYSRFYYKHFARELRSMGIDPESFMTFERFQKSLRELALFGAVYSCICATYVKLPLKDMKLNCPEDFKNYTKIDRIAEIKAMMNSNADYNHYLHERIHDLMELALNRNFGDKV